MDQGSKPWWVSAQENPTDVIVKVGEASFCLHKFMLVKKSDYIRKLIMEAEESELTRIDLSGIPGGPGIFEKAAKFCYSVNFEITVHNVAVLRCAAEFLQMNDQCYDNNLARRTEDFLSQVAFFTLTGAVTVLKSCQHLLPLADDLKIIKRCVEAVGAKALSEANFPTRSPPYWWTEELAALNIDFFGRVIDAMRLCSAKPLTLATAVITYTEGALKNLLHNNSGKGIQSSDPLDSEARDKQQKLLESIVDQFPFFPIHFLCRLLRCAIYVHASTTCKVELENRISALLEHVKVDDLLVMSFTYDGEKLFDLESVQRIVSRFVEKEKSVAVSTTSTFREHCSGAMHRVAKTFSVYLVEIAAYGELSISKFNDIAVLIPKHARKVDDELYRAIDIYLKAHPRLDEKEREEVCSVMDPLRLSHEARVHASQNKRLPMQIVVRALHHDHQRLKREVDDGYKAALLEKKQPQAEAESLMRENEELRTELMKMKVHLSDLQKNVVQVTAATPFRSFKNKKNSVFSSLSKRFGKFNPFRGGYSGHIEDGPGDFSKPRSRRFSLS